MRKLLLFLFLIISGAVFGQYKSDSCYWYEDIYNTSHQTVYKYFDIDIKQKDSTVIYISNPSDSADLYILKLNKRISIRSIGEGAFVYLYEGKDLTVNKNALISILFKDGRLAGIGISDSESLLIWDIRKKIEVKSL